MKRAKCSASLDRMGFIRAKFGGVLVKETEQKGEPNMQVMQRHGYDRDQFDKHIQMYRAVSAAPKRDCFSSGL